MKKNLIIITTLLVMLFSALLGQANAQTKKDLKNEIIVKSEQFTHSAYQITETEEIDISILINHEMAKKMYSDGKIIFNDSHNLFGCIESVNNTFSLLNNDLNIYYPHFADEIEFIIFDTEIEKYIESTSNLIPTDNYTGYCIHSSKGKYIAIETKSITNNKNMSVDTMTKNLVHEIGHFVDFSGTNHRYTRSESFLEIYQKYKNEYKLTDYQKADEKEFFTTIFIDYYLNPEKITKYPELIEEIFKAWRFVNKQ